MRGDVWSECRLKIEHFESVQGLERAVRRFWALMYWIFENIYMTKLFISENYCIIKNDRSLMEQRGR